MNTEVSDVLIHSPTALPLLYSREVGGFGRSLYIRKSEYVGYLAFKVILYIFFSSLKNYSYCIFLVLK